MNAPPLFVQFTCLALALCCKATAVSGPHTVAWSFQDDRIDVGTEPLTTPTTTCCCQYKNTTGKIIPFQREKGEGSCDDVCIEYLTVINKDRASINVLQKELYLDGACPATTL